MTGPSLERRSGPSGGNQGGGGTLILEAFKGVGTCVREGGPGARMVGGKTASIMRKGPWERELA